jgi:hypothetical protein
MKLIDLTGKTFGRWTVNRRGPNSSCEDSRWYCKCDCGNERLVLSYMLVGGRSKSCGCLNAEIASERAKTIFVIHGMHKSNVYSSWNGMIRRCYDPKLKAYPNYGGRGIRVCEFLRASPKNILALIGERPDGKSIDRIDNDLHYSCGQCAECFRCGYTLNVKWSTPREQGRNTRSNHLIEHDGQILCISEWSRRLNIPRSRFKNRLKAGKDPFLPVAPHYDKIRKEVASQTCP